VAKNIILLKYLLETETVLQKKVTYREMSPENLRKHEEK
jgi:hypothetical protein